MIRKARDTNMHVRHTRWQRARYQSALAPCTTRAGELREIGCCVRPFYTEKEEMWALSQ